MSFSIGVCINWYAMIKNLQLLVNFSNIISIKIYPRIPQVFMQYV